MITELKRKALFSLKGNWGTGVLTWFLFAILRQMGGMLIYVILLVPFFILVTTNAVFADEFIMLYDYGEMGPTILISYMIAVIFIMIGGAMLNVLYFGVNEVFLHAARTNKTKVDYLFNIFKNWRALWRKIKAMVLVNIFVLLWSLLFIVPGIIKLLSYSMTQFIMIDYPEYSTREAIQKSQDMMKGHKKELFLLMLSFIGWALLGMVTLGIGFLWIGSYLYTTIAHFYLRISGQEEVLQ